MERNRNKKSFGRSGMIIERDGHDRAFRLALLQKVQENAKVCFHFIQCCLFRRDPRNRRNKLFVECCAANEDTQHIAQVSGCALLALQDRSGVWEVDKAGR